MRLPGTRLLAVARLLVEPVAVARILEPLVADWQREWLAAGSSSSRAIARVRGLFSFLLQNWITPYANQAFREHITFRAAERAGRVAMYRPPRPGVRELTLSELYRASLSTPGVIASPAKVNEELHGRITLPLIPILLAMLGWCLGRVSNSARTRRLVGWWVLACVTFGFSRDLGMTLERLWSLPREIAAWFPLALWSVAIIVLMRSTRNATGGSDHLRQGYGGPP